MNTTLKKLFNLTDIRYPWLLLISMCAFIFSLYYDKNHTNISLAYQWMTYGFTIISATVWSILNYIAHIKISANYKKYDNIDTYVENLLISKEEKLELKGYLEDYSSDLISQGKTKEESIQTAINQFRVQEFTSLSKNSSLFNLPIHYYLIGYSLLSITVATLLEFMPMILKQSPFLFSAIQFMLISYCIGFTGSFFLYKLLDSIISKKTNNDR
ncbi:hypothetical protein EDD66_107172 [Mobilisporobacter senegalensis]|uniref:Uncharacterized protein n=1 Tax=Mobilisporobacter senegalensis TaxID=1329262 RepID=A0A3N1XM56_9FIRM|nr:hypothetical protein [Mobilisporobacter senegalensis]ROR27258.1 hypothetical protein EDD66_107172 [Mobilisporobacter senegalensis]